jgi:hypothetical protein
MGPSWECAPMMISSADRAIIVAADMAAPGTMTRM